MSAIEGGAMQDKAGAQVDDLVKRARSVADHAFSGTPLFVAELADALEAQSAELTRLRERNAELEAKVFNLDLQFDGALQRENFAREQRDAALSRITPLEARLEAFRKALAPFSMCAAPFGKDWSDNDEIACEPMDLNGEGGNGYLLFALKVSDFRKANALMSALRMEGEKDGVE